MTDPRSALVLAAVARWNKSHPPSQDIDPAAELAVTRQEGLSGGIGDGGHAFGPNQANDAGGTLTGKLPSNWTPQQKNAWAWSPPGLDFQLSGVAAASGGQHGARAIENTIRKYERPADPNGEVARALGQSGGGAAPGAGPSPQSGAATPPVSNQGSSRQAFARALLGAISPTGTLNDPTAFVGALQQRQAPQAQAFAPSPMVSAAGGAPSAGGLASVGGVQVDPSIAGQVQQIIGRFGVHPTSGYRSADHNAAVGGAPHSDHLTGDAVDFGGNPSQLAALYKWSQGRYPYVEPWSQTGGTHDHISFARR